MKNKLNLLLLAAAILSFWAVNITAQTQRCIQPPSQMTAWFPLDESSGTTTANKISGGNPGTLMGTPAWISGKVANALNLGANGYVKVADQPLLNFGTGNFSIDAWIKIKQGTSPVRMIVDKRNSALVGYLFFVYQNNKLGLQLGQPGTYANYLSPVIPNLTDGNWHHVAGTVDRTSPTGAKFYFDGAPNGTANPTAISGNLTNTDPLRIGSELGTGNFLNGAIDEVELFNRVLKPQEVKALFAAQGFGKCKEPVTPVNPCCPPINPNVVAENLVYKGGAISAPYTLKFQATMQFMNQMQTYINYVNSTNSAINKITVEWRLHDQGTGSVPMTFPTGSSPGNNGPLIETAYTTWTAGGSGSPAIAGNPNFFGTGTNPFPMQVNTWYMIHTGTYFEDGGIFFPRECADNDIFVRIQVLGIARGASPVLEFSNRSGEIIGRKELK